MWLAQQNLKSSRQVFSSNNFDLVTIVPANEIREIIRGVDYIEQVCKLCDVDYKKILSCDYRKKQSKLHKERKENRYHLFMR